MAERKKETAKKRTARQKTEIPMLDYLKWRGDLTFAAAPFNEVDNLVLCTIAYLRFARFPQLRAKNAALAVPIGQVAKEMKKEDDQLGLSEFSYLPVIREAAKSTRFGGVRLFGYENELSEGQESQFQAISFLLPDDTVFAAFMGTDTSLAGWKEDFNMSYLTVPAQKRAAGYAAEIAAVCEGKKLRIGGHSKGGNLAAWAAIHLPERVQKEQLLAIYNNDGPGFSQALTETAAYENVAKKLHTFVPEDSIVGVLLEHAGDYVVVGSVNRGIAQHDIISWKCEGDHLVHVGHRSQLGQASEEVVRQWIGSMTPREREAFSDALFDIVSGDGKYHTIEEVKIGDKGIWELLRRFSKADAEKKKVITDIFRRLRLDINEELRRGAEQNVQSVRDNLRTAIDTLGEKKK